MTDALANATARLRGIEGPTFHGVGGRRHILEREYADAVTLAMAYLAEHPTDGGESVTTEWLVEMGGRITSWSLKPYGDKDNPAHRYPTVKFGPFVWYTNLWTGHLDGTYTATFSLKYQGACLGSSPELTRDQFRHLCAGLGVDLLHGGQARPEGGGE
jgi:hypothetical protein